MLLELYNMIYQMLVTVFGILVLLTNKYLMGFLIRLFFSDFFSVKTASCGFVLKVFSRVSCQCYSLSRFHTRAQSAINNHLDDVIWNIFIYSDDVHFTLNVIRLLIFDNGIRSEKIWELWSICIIHSKGYGSVLDEKSSFNALALFLIRENVYVNLFYKVFFLRYCFIYHLTSHGILLSFFCS